MQIGTLVVRINGDATGLQGAMRSVNASMAKAGKAMTSTGKSMTMSLTAPLVAAGAAAFNLYKGFESSMSKINGLVGVAKAQVDQWSKEILQIAPALGKAPKELADALFFVTSAGIKGAKAMEVLKASAQASAAGLGETKVVADLVTSAMNAYGPSMLSATQATDILVASVREGKAEATSLASAMGQVLPIASEMNVSFDQVGAAIAAMTRTGTEANTASMQLKNILMAMLKPTDQAAEALKTMGTSASEMRKKIREGGLIKTLAELRTMTNQYGEDAMAKVFPNIRALSGVLDLMGKNAGDNIEIFDKLKNATGSLDNAFAAAAETAQFKYDQAISSVKTTLTTLGESVSQAIIPIINRLAVSIQKVGNWFSSLNQSQKESVLRWAAILAALGPVLMLLGSMVTVVTALATAFAFLTSPIGLIIVAIAAVAAAVLYIWDNWAAVKERISDISWWKNTIINMVKFLIEYNPMSLLMKGINAIIEKFGGDPIPNPFESVAEALEGLKYDTKDYEHQFGSFMDAVKSGMNAVTGLFPKGGAGSGIAALVPTAPQIQASKDFNEQLGFVPELLAKTKELTPTDTNVYDAATPTEGQIEKLSLFSQETLRLQENIGYAIEGALTDAAVGIGEMIGYFAAGAEGLETFGDFVAGLGVVIMQSVADLAKQIGIMAIESGVALLAIKIGLESMNPFIMIAAGVALVALAGFVSSKAKGLGGGISNTGTDAGQGNLQGLATGGTVTRPGAFMVGERGPEMVSLPAGAAVTPNNALGNGGMTEQLIARLSGADIEIVLERWATEKNRMS